MEDWSGCCWLHGRKPENPKSPITGTEAGNDRIEAVVDGRGSAVAGCRFGDSTVCALAAPASRAQKAWRRRNRRKRTWFEPKEIDWRRPVALGTAACLPLLMAASIVVVPSGMGGVRISQIRGTLPGTLYPGVHFVTPLVDSVQTVRPARSPVHRRHCGTGRKEAAARTQASTCSRSKA